MNPFENQLPGMLFPLGFDAKVIHEKSGKKKETCVDSSIFPTR